MNTGSMKENRRMRAGLIGALVLGFLTLGAVGPAPESPVADAAETGEIDVVRELLRSGADVNASQGDGMTALHWATVRDDAEMTKLLIYAGASLGATTRLGGYTPLHLASQYGFADVAAALLEAGADVGAVTTTGVMPLHLAAESGDAETVRALLTAGAEIDRSDEYAGRTPLMFATAYGRHEAMEALIQAGADVSLATNVVDYAERAEVDSELRQRRLRMMAAARGDEPEQPTGPSAAQPSSPPDTTVAVEDEKKGEKPEEEKEPEPPIAPDPDRPTSQDPVDPRAYKGNDSTQVFPTALSYDGLVGKQGGMTALHYAARDGRMDAARRLLAAGADVNQLTGGDQSTPLLVAVINGNYDLAMFLLEAGGDPNLLSEDGAGPLFAVLNSRWALRTWYPQPTAWQQQETTYIELMRSLLEAGAEPDARVHTHIWYTAYNAGRMGVDFGGATPFWRAAYALDVEAMRLLSEFGADPNIATRKPASRRRSSSPDDEEEDPSGLPPVEAGGVAVHPLHAASGVGYGTSRVGQQHRHVPNGWLPAVRYLVDELGVDVDVRDHDGYSAVHNAAARGDNEVIEFLVERGADVTFVSRRGQTTVDMANGPQQRVQPFPETIALLEALGATNNHNCQSC